MSMLADRIRGMNRSIACLDSSKKNHGWAALTPGAATSDFEAGASASSSRFLLMPLPWVVGAVSVRLLSRLALPDRPSMKPPRASWLPWSASVGTT